jgi:hypothetical protein
MAAKKTAKTADSPTVTPKPAAKKTATKKVAAKKAATTSAPPKPSIDVIARAAYLNYRRRVELGLPGDSQDDWLKAEQGFSSPN